MGVTQQELESRLWDAANSLRGPVDPADFKAYVFPLLFFKWISDTWDMEHDQEADTWPLDALYGTALVVRIMRDMDEDNHERGEVLLSTSTTGVIVARPTCQPPTPAL